MDTKPLQAGAKENGYRRKNMIPQVNATATDVEREKTKRICELLGLDYCKNSPGHSEVLKFGGTGNLLNKVAIPNGSLTLDQCVGMLKGLGWTWHPIHFDPKKPEICPVGGRWVHETIYKDAEGRRRHKFRDLDINVTFPHSLSDALDALIKVLEEKK